MSFLSPTSPVERDLTDDITHGATRKRKRGQTDAYELDRRLFTIRPDHSNPFAKPRTFTPQCLLARAQLPLAYLDNAAEGTRLFSALVETLERCHEHQTEAKVLIVQCEDGYLHAVERVKTRKYALCRLGHWVNKSELLQRATIRLQPEESQRKRQALQPLENGQPWWALAAARPSVSRTDVGCTLPRLGALPLSSRAVGAASEILQIEPVAPTITDPMLEEAEDGAMASKSNSSDKCLEELTRQYLDALYLSRTPLAYFVKGPLSRARAAFNSNPQDLITFLRASILTQSVLEKKYRDSIPETISALPLLDTPQAKPKTQRKRKWKLKRDKQGLFVDEKDFVEQWWRKEDDSINVTAPNESRDALLKSRLAKLRIRETFLQLIIVLETLAVELSAPPKPVLAAGEETKAIEAESQAPEPQLDAKDKKNRKKKEVDLEAVLETILDRLCIFYSLESSSPVKTMGAPGSAANHEANDDLRAFSTEVIIPFFASRIHAVASNASKKLGGPSAPELKGRKSAGTARKPGEPALRQPPDKQARKPFTRSSTDTFNHLKSKPPSLQRSATDQDALAPLIKRERSETPSLKDIPTTNSKARQTATRKRSSLMDQYSASNRQVDFSAMSQVNQAKIRRKNDIDEKLRDALKSIKKPNRALATEETAKNADESFARAISKSKTSKPHPQRSTFPKEPAAITATPRHNKATPAPRRRADAVSNDRGSGATSIFPSSSTKLLSRPGIIPESSFAIPQKVRTQRHRNVEETPSRGFAKYMPMGLSREPGTLLESPTMARTSATIAGTPAKPCRLAKVAETPDGKGGGFSSLVEGRGPEKVVDASPGGRVEGKSAAGDGSGPRKTSLYAALGWDEEYEELA